MNLNTKKELEALYAKEVWFNSTLGEAAEIWANKFKDRIALCCDGDSISYQELNERANAISIGLIKLGFKPNDKVVVQLPNSINFVSLVFGMFKAGIIPVFALPAQRKNEIVGVIKSSEAVGYVIPGQYMGYDYLHLAREVCKAGFEGQIIVDGDNQGFIPFDNLSLEQGTVDVENVSPSDIAFYLLSGGTTGIPKLIPRRHGDYLYMAQAVGKRCELGEDDVYLVSLPVEHNFPWGCPGVIGTLNVGGRVVFATASSPDEILGLIEEEEVTITGLVPVLGKMCIDLLEYDDYDLSSLKVVQIGGSVLEPKLAMAIEEGFGCVLQQIFGIAEGLICCTKLDDEPEVRFFKQGTPVSTYDEPRIVDSKGIDVAPGEFGHLITRGPYTIYGYVNAEEINKSCVDEECYFQTGDRARICEDGNFQVVGRLVEMINRGGEKIDPTELEEALLKHPEIDDVQVVGIKDDNLGERICVFVLGDDLDIQLNDVRSFLQESDVASFKLPDQIKCVSQWPLTNVGKIDRNSLKELGAYA